MIQDKMVLAIIPARGGSKTVPRKNIREMYGKPLIAWTIEEAKKSRYIDRLILSSDDDEIIRCAMAWGCEVPFVRPSELAQDTTPGIEPVLHAIKTLSEKYDYIVMLQPTSPLREVQDIDGCIEFCLKMNALTCVSITEVEKSPYWMYKMDDRGTLRPVLEQGCEYFQRQGLPTVYQLNGAVYVSDVNWLRKSRKFVSLETVGYVMPEQRSFDIDNFVDFRICDLMLRDRNRETLA